MSRTVIIVQARMGSTRLPGKPLKEVAGKTLLSHLIERLRRTKKSDEIVIATTDNEKDQVIVDLCHEEQIPVFRGSEDDVLDRYYQTSKSVGADTIVRITADCPLMDPDIVDEVITYFLDHDDDYASNILERKLPRGMDVEVFSFKALEEAAKNATSPEDREHVTPYFYRNPKKFRLGSVVREGDTSRFRLTVDTTEDLQLITLILEALYPKEFHLKDILELLKQNPEWEKINASVMQKQLYCCDE